MCGEANFIDILVARRTQSGIFRFMTRDWYPKKTQELEKNFTPQNLKDIASRSLYLEAVIEAESLYTGVSKEDLKKEVLKYIEEIGMDKKLHVIRWLGIFSIKLAFNMNIGIFVNETAILKVKSTMGKNPLLFLPTHRSYADFCILTYLCYHYDIEFPAVASGMDFYSMAVIGQVLRETCAFYIRRTLVGAPLYAATLKQYVRTLVAKYSAPIEFFLEGTRSRSNKSLPPKYGMLSMALAPLFAREVPDITIVPVNISYDRLMEQSTFAYELLGVPKPKESTRGLLKWLTSLNDQFGNMYINLGEPISVRDYVKKIPYSDESLKPLDLQNLSPEQFRQVQEVAEYTVTQQQANTVATISNLLAIVLMQSVVNQKCLTYEQVLEEVDWLKKVLRDLGGTVFEDDVTRNVDRILSIHAKSWVLDKDRQLRLVSSDVIDVTDDLKRKMKGHKLNAETMMNAIPVIQLQIYVNPMLHYLVPSALICLLVQRGSFKMDELSQRYRCLRKLLRHEFFHIEQNEEKTFKQAFDYCVRNGVATVVGARLGAGAGGGALAGAGPAGAGGGALRRLLRGAAWPALTTLKICADVITEQGSCTHSEVVKLVQSRAESQRRHPYCLSLDAAAHCVLGLAAAGALVKLKREDITEYHLVPDVMAKCRELVDSVLPDIEADFSSRNPVILDRRAKSRL